MKFSFNWVCFPHIHAQPNLATLQGRNVLMCSDGLCGGWGKRGRQCEVGDQIP